MIIAIEDICFGVKFCFLHVQPELPEHLILSLIKKPHMRNN